MTCDQNREKIPGLVRRELSGFERIPVLDHLQHCPDCQAEYKQYLKIFYSIDLEIVSPPPLTLPVNVLAPATQAHKIKSGFPDILSSRSFYVAAAILILGIALIGYLVKVFSPDQQYRPGSTESVRIDISQTGSLAGNIDSKIETMIAEDRISVNFIENQLLFLQKKGIENFKLQQSGSAADLSAAGPISPIYDKSVPVNNCLEKVKSIKKYKSYFTISELVTFLNNLEKQGA
jgi:Putative zinc-finger